MKLAISIDVEEEGLFTGAYPRIPQGVGNVNELRRLEFISSEFGFPLTLLVAYSVGVSPACRRVLHYFRDNLQAEIGAHLHPWNTPPFQDLPYGEPIRSDLLPSPLLRAKFETLLASLENHLGVIPNAFRMGRFDLRKKVLELLPEYGLAVDSSFAPLHDLGDPGQFLAPAEPFWLDCGLEGGADARIFEVPLTIVPLLRGAPRLFYRLASRMSPPWRDAFLTKFRQIGAAGIHPAWFPLNSMKLAARLHRKRGGTVLNMFLHSSELKPGATPEFLTEGSVDNLVQKIREFLTWLVRTGPVEGVTLSGLYRLQSR